VREVPSLTTKEREMKKLTLASLKSFVKKNRANLYIRCDSRFDGMVDGLEFNRGAKFNPAMDADRVFDNNLGIAGVWVVRGGRDLVSPYEDDKFKGMSVYNCCGSFVVAVPK
jgi:hypothetical protein